MRTAVMFDWLMTLLLGPLVEYMASVGNAHVADRVKYMRKCRHFTERVHWSLTVVIGWGLYIPMASYSCLYVM